MDAEDTARAFAACQRERELEMLREIAVHLSLAPGRLSLLTIVTKQDLWWEQREEVRRHYEGAYADVIEQLRRRIGEQNLAHKLWSVSLIAKNMRDVEGRVLAPTARGYDELLQASNRRRLLEIVAEEASHA